MNVIGYTELGSILVVIDDTEMTVPDDMSNRHRRAIAEWEAVGNAIPVYVEPPAPVPEEISDRQFFQQLAILGLVTQEEALAAVMTGTLPAAMENFIAALPEEERFPARMLLSGATGFRRSHPLTTEFGAMQGMDAADIDNLWRQASQL